MGGGKEVIRMSDAEVALKLLEYVQRLEPANDKEKFLAQYRECLAAVRGKAE